MSNSWIDSPTWAIVPQCSFIGAIIDVARERQKQDQRWGEQNHDPVYWIGILAEERGEAAKEAIELTDQRWTPALREELVQLAAVAVAAIESLDRAKHNAGGATTT